ncbi:MULTISPECIES: DUF4435 domain-containing protein [unclassified Pseudomonas]|uniref:DUF4435 domain-containing protein n=1 Tax=unclassified Pseudomonas TaxID=196821 RepID=UPI0009F50A7E|nr:MULTISPECIES: DUF4435 domain-containing protein [unclassified Pseudomonas]QOF82719.1 DUF4435 domain-containing protein [Pseudomonas sp. ADPe]
MRAFTRTVSGIANYHKFHHANFTVFIEGKVLSDSDDDGVLYKDIRYYLSILSAASDGRKAKVKCLGNKAVVLEYAKVISRNNIPNSFVLIDKDLEGVITSSLNCPGVVRTYGYSWENELWTSSTVSYVVDQLTGSCQRAVNDAGKYYNQLLRKVKYLSALDAAAQADGTALLKKSSALCGVGFNFPYLPTGELKRVAQRFRALPAANCDICKEVARYAYTKSPEEIIQGHFWSNVAMRLIAFLYKKHTGDTPPSNGVLENIALSGIASNPLVLAGEKLIGRYHAELARVGILPN